MTKELFVQSKVVTSFEVVCSPEFRENRNKSWKSKWKQKSNPNRRITKYHHKFDSRINLLINKSNLNKHQCGIMIRLITEHIELNKYLYLHDIKCPKYNQIPLSPNCTFCNQIESTKHFFMNCNKYKPQRSIQSTIQNQP